LGLDSGKLKSESVSSFDGVLDSDASHASDAALAGANGSISSDSYHRVEVNSPVRHSFIPPSKRLKSESPSS